MNNFKELYVNGETVLTSNQHIEGNPHQQYQLKQVGSLIKNTTNNKWGKVVTFNLTNTYSNYTSVIELIGGQTTYNPTVYAKILIKVIQSGDSSSYPICKLTLLDYNGVVASDIKAVRKDRTIILYLKNRYKNEPVRINSSLEGYLIKEVKFGYENGYYSDSEIIGDEEFLCDNKSIIQLNKWYSNMASASNVGHYIKLCDITLTSTGQKGYTELKLIGVGLDKPRVCTLYVNYEQKENFGNDPLLNIQIKHELKQGTYEFDKSHVIGVIRSNTPNTFVSLFIRGIRQNEYLTTRLIEHEGQGQFTEGDKSFWTTLPSGTQITCSNVLG